MFISEIGGPIELHVNHFVLTISQWLFKKKHHCMQPNS